MLIYHTKRLNFRFFIQTCRYFSTVKQDKYQNFKDAIDKKFPYAGDRVECLSYLKTVFDSFQCMVHVKYYNQHVINTKWFSLLDPDERERITKTLDYAHKSENYKQMNIYLLENFHKFSPKGISLVCRMHRALNITDKSVESHRLMQLLLDDYCMANISAFDLTDIYNLEFVASRSFLAKSSRHVSHLLMTNYYDDAMITLDMSYIQPNEGEFENEMRKHDLKNSMLWLKLKIFLNYRSIYKDKDSVDFIVNAFYELTRALKKINSPLYKVNVLNLLFRCSNYKYDFEKLSNEISKCIEEIKNEHLEEHVKHFDLIEYKNTIRSSLVFLNQHEFLKPKNVVSYLLSNVQSKLLNSKDLTKVEFFSYCSCFFDLVNKEKIVRKTKLKKEDLVKYQIHPIYRVSVTNILNLSDELKQAISLNYDKFIKDADMASLSGFSDGLFVVYHVHHDKTAALNSLYEKLLCLLDQNTLRYIVPFTATMILGSNEETKKNELKLANLVIKLKFWKRNTSTVRHVLSVLMLNSETILSQFNSINNLVSNNLYSHAAVFELIKLFYLFNKHFSVLIKQDKKNTLRLCSILFSKIIDEFNYLSRLHRIESTNVAKLFINIAKEARIQYLDNVITFDEYNHIFSSAQQFQLEDVNEKDFKETNPLKYMQLYARIGSLQTFYKHGRYYSIKNMKKVWFYLIDYMEWDLAGYNQNAIDGVFIDAMGMAMSSFDVFDFTQSVPYKENIERFRELSQQFYKKYKALYHVNMKRLSLYAYNLVSLDCHVPEVFDDVLHTVLMKPELRGLFTQIFPYLSIHYPTYRKQLRFDLEEIIFRPNKIFLRDFRLYMSQFLPDEISNSHVYKIGIDDSNKIVSRKDTTARLKLSIILIDRIHSYQNSSELLRNVSSCLNNLNSLGIQTMQIREEEFYDLENRDRIFLEKINQFLV